MTSYNHPPALDGHQLAARQISKHGADRYQTVHQQMAKVISKAAELLTAIYVHQQSHDAHAPGECPQVRSELADTGLSLFELANKLQLNLLACMDELVENDGRKFGGPGHSGSA